jgi:hypothetical protein
LRADRLLRKCIARHGRRKGILWRPLYFVMSLLYFLCVREFGAMRFARLNIQGEN